MDVRTALLTERRFAFGQAQSVILKLRDSASMGLFLFLLSG